MKNDVLEYEKHGMTITIRLAEMEDATTLGRLRATLDGETDHFDRVYGENVLTEEECKAMIEACTSPENLLLVAEAEGRIVGYLRAQGSQLRKLAHRVEFGVGVSKKYWGYSIGKSLIIKLLRWADEKQIHKVMLQVLETNVTAIQLYEKLGFKKEGLLIDDKKHGDTYQHTIIMGRVKQEGEALRFPSL
ncbi:GNAT family N-acetyltransferase [Shouchella miscanthi]|uniref:GNAT family N-acetyltransferase n=1 Tax=Shouchella miscanthi TaxID=2598861 RepID=UPI0011A92C82|nr:GNAT family N-acetyltransferase [Shouchella miscanthi]